MFARLRSSESKFSFISEQRISEHLPKNFKTSSDGKSFSSKGFANYPNNSFADVAKYTGKKSDIPIENSLYLSPFCFCPAQSKIYFSFQETSQSKTSWPLQPNSLGP